MPNIDINIAAAASEMRAYSLNLLTDTVRLAGDLGARGVVIGPGKANPLFPAETPELIEHFHSALGRLNPIANSVGTSLWVENMPFAFLPGIDQLMRALVGFGDDEIRIVYDAANAHFIGEDIASGLQRCKCRLALVHLSDTAQKIYKHDPVGEGTVPFGDILSALAAVGYTVQSMLEIISRNPDADIVASAVKLAKQGLGSSVHLGKR